MVANSQLFFACCCEMGSGFQFLILTFMNWNEFEYEIFMIYHQHRIHKKNYGVDGFDWKPTRDEFDWFLKKLKWIFWLK